MTTRPPKKLYLFNSGPPVNYKTHRSYTKEQLDNLLYLPISIHNFIRYHRRLRERAKMRAAWCSEHPHTKTCYGVPPRNSPDSLMVYLDLTQFRLLDLFVRMDENFLVIEGHQDRPEESAAFIPLFTPRRYPIPRRFDIDNIITTISYDGILAIEIPKHHELWLTDPLFELQQQEETNYEPITVYDINNNRYVPLHEHLR